MALCSLYADNDSIVAVLYGNEIFMKIKKGKNYVCLTPYSDGYANITEGEFFTPHRVGYSAQGEAGTTWVYPKQGHPIPLEVLLACFEEYK